MLELPTVVTAIAPSFAPCPSLRPCLTGCCLLDARVTCMSGESGRARRRVE
jgi:hypothetical protein